jgi:hypothetical protein
MTKRSYVIVLAVFVLLVLAALALRGNGVGAFMHVMSSMHGPRQ